MTKSVLARAPGRNPAGFDVYSTLAVDGGEYAFSYTIPPINTRSSPLPKLAEGLEDVLASGRRRASANNVPSTRTAKDALDAGVSRPVDQGECGACWAIVVAQNMMDQVVVQIRSGARSGTEPVRPPSFTWSLACFARADPCGGGDVLELVQHAATYGIPADTCSDFSWCCDRKNIPSCGCGGTGKGEHDVFFTRGAATPIYAGVASKLDPERVRLSLADVGDVLQTYILQRGSIVANLQLYSNFLDGKFCFVNGGVYLERIRYDRHESVYDEPAFTTNDEPAGVHVGGHAVCVVGWGVARDVFVDAGVRADVPYWVCRNSWGEHWGQDGFFKLARHPFNRACQIEAPVNVLERTEKGRMTRVRTGGALAFDVDVSLGVKIL